ncbi:Integrase core domain protein [Falsiruegeria litorea R37]|uniref:Integrase core domain protein n=1 Tax=Falsiruegeria litorea R37 TaxID=1200284 RepID=A0A1Y5R7L0_9RHOB|nr:DDE-type integrase/transposase/recombinase [Falsiruegeria litorea]SLN11014.1 Integrase core domain protein [Falsiruegeria litorea R37]
MKDTAQKYIGWLVLLDDQAFSVIEVGVTHGSLTLVNKDGSKVVISNERFRDLIHAEMAFDPDEDTSARNRMLDKKDQLELGFRKRILTAIRLLRGGGLTWTAAYNQLFLDFSSDTFAFHRVGGFPSLRTVKKWDTDDRNKGEAALRPQHKNKGNRTPRFDLLFENITLDILEERFLTSDRMSITKLCKLARAVYREKCKELDMKPGPCGHKSVKAIVQRLPHADIVKLRLGSSEARKQYLLAMKLQEITVPLERVEADSTTLDVWCVDDEGDPVGRPMVCAAIDCATGVILGLQVAWGAPSSSLVARTIKEIFTPKSDAFFDRIGIQNRFQAIGIPQQIVSDQGTENSGPLIASFLSSATLDWSKCVPGQPDRKPFIERLMLELSRFITQFQGASQTSEIGAQKRTEIA